MTAWWASLAVDRLQEETDKRWPNRDKSSDGIIGDAAHAARQSDHNPLPDGEVCAIDITSWVDNAGHNVAEIVAHQLVTDSLSKDSRIKYVIWDRMIFDLAVSPQWRPYSGSDPHTSHVHVSVYPNCSGTNTFHIYNPPEVKSKMLILTRLDGSDQRLVDQNTFAIHAIMGPNDISSLRTLPPGAVSYWPNDDAHYAALVNQHGV